MIVKQGTVRKRRLLRLFFQIYPPPPPLNILVCFFSATFHAFQRRRVSESLIIKLELGSAQAWSDSMSF